MKTYVWGLDLSLSSTGVCIFTNDGNFVTSFSIDTSKEKETKMKLKLIGETYLREIKKYKPSIVVIEQGFSLFNTSTQQTFRVHGITNYIFSEYEQVYYPATTVKKTITGIGNAPKEEVRRLILSQYKDINFGTLDESDAFAVADTYFIKNKLKKEYHA